MPVAMEGIGFKSSFVGLSGPDTEAEAEVSASFTSLQAHSESGSSEPFRMRTAKISWAVAKSCNSSFRSWGLQKGAA